MNWLLIIIVLLLALCVVNGYRKGFLRMMYSMVSWVIMFAPVSYTHLDVYKRQPCGQSGEKAGKRCCCCTIPKPQAGQ